MILPFCLFSVGISSPSLHFDWLVPPLSSGKMTLKLFKCVFFRHPVRSNAFCYISTSPLRDRHFHDPSHKWLLSVKDKVTSLQRGGIYGCQRWEFLGKCEGCSILDGSSFKNTCKWSPGPFCDWRMHNSQGQQWILIRLRCSSMKGPTPAPLPNLGATSWLRRQPFELHWWHCWHPARAPFERCGWGAMASVLFQETVDTNHYGILENKKVLKCGETLKCQKFTEGGVGNLPSCQGETNGMLTQALEMAWVPRVSWNLNLFW